MLSRSRVLLTGATGYVGGRLLAALEASGRPLRCLARRPDVLRARAASTTEIVGGELLDPVALAAALDDVDTAYYLVHSMGAHGDYRQADIDAARAFGAAASAAGVRRIIYLGGLAHDDGALSKHLKSRLETGDALREGGVPVLEFRASIVIGSGGLSFEMIRALVERLPVMICPRWVATEAQPIGIDDLLAYLMAGLEFQGAGHAVFEIGGADRASYGDLMREYARQRGLRRLMISVPLLTPHLSSLWLGLVTPVYARVGRELIEGLRNRSVVQDDAARSAFPVRPLGMADAIARAIRNEDRSFALTRWSDALQSGGGPKPLVSARFGSRLVDARTLHVDLPPEQAFAPIACIGGNSGWYYGTWMWKLRGYADLLLGGVGMRRGRRDPGSVVVGDTVDFWRVEAFEPGRRLRLAAEMKVPGRAWLEFEAVPDGSGTTLHQTAVFDPMGLWGLLYWYSLVPVHGFIFGGMLRNIADRARAGSDATKTRPHGDRLPHAAR